MTLQLVCCSCSQHQASNSQIRLFLPWRGLGLGLYVPRNSPPQIQKTAESHSNLCNGAPPGSSRAKQCKFHFAINNCPQSCAGNYYQQTNVEIIEKPWNAESLIIIVTDVNRNKHASLGLAAAAGWDGPPLVNYWLPSHLLSWQPTSPSHPPPVTQRIPSNWPTAKLGYKYLNLVNSHTSDKHQAVLQASSTTQ